VAAEAVGSRLPRLGLVFSFRQCDKKDQGWRKDPLLFNALSSFDSGSRAFTLR
jgi:hypothetical protein